MTTPSGFEPPVGRSPRKRRLCSWSFWDTGVEVSDPSGGLATVRAGDLLGSTGNRYNESIRARNHGLRPRDQGSWYPLDQGAGLNFQYGKDLPQTQPVGWWRAARSVRFFSKLLFVFAPNLD